MHALSAVAPTALEAFPAAQTTHALAPVVPEYVFTGHKTHTAAALAPATPEYAPAAQVRHTFALVAPDTPEYVPAEQFTHDEFPVIFLNFPATQAVQTPPSGPVYPALHLQSEIFFDVLVISEVENLGHLKHLSCVKKILI